MKKYVFPLILLCCLLIIRCKQKNKSDENKESFFPVLSFIKSQVAQIDTSLYSIKKIVLIDSTHSDTVFVPREEFKNLAKDFLDLPDLTEKKFKDRYIEEKLFDEQINRVSISYKPKKPEEEDIQKQEILIKPDPAEDKIASIFIDRVINNRDSFLHKIMFWQIDRSFQITTISQKPAKPETTTILKVVWGKDDEE